MINSFENENYSDETRFLRQASVFSGVTAFLFWIITAAMGLPAMLWLCTLGTVIFSSALWLTLRKNCDIVLPTWLFFLWHSFALSVGFFYNGGTHGTVLYIFFLTLGVVVYLIPFGSRTFLFCSVVNVSLLIYLEILIGGIEIPHANETARSIDVGVAVILCLVIMYWLMRFSRKSYDTEKRNAENSNVAKSRFLATMSHEIRTPLNAVLGMNKAALDELSGQPIVKEYLETVSESAEHLLSVINDILDFSKIEAGFMELELTDFSPQQIINSVGKAFEAHAEQKGVKILFDLDRDCPEFLYGDSHRLRQVLYNLVSNALKFTQKGSITLSLNVKKGKPGFYRFEVLDTGKGIPEAKKADLFKAFKQLSDQGNRIYGSSGLGLSISKQLVELMKGQIGVDSEIGVGSRFYFEVPLTTIVGRSLEVKKIEDAKKLLGAKVLLVEDNFMNQKVAGILLKKIQVLYDVAGDGCEALKMMAENQYDLILMDLEMPVLNGIETTQKIRNEEIGGHSKNIPIIALTAHALADSKEQCDAVGMNGFVTKPIRLKELSDLMALHMPSAKLK